MSQHDCRTKKKNRQREAHRKDRTWAFFDNWRSLQRLCKRRRSVFDRIARATRTRRRQQRRWPVHCGTLLLLLLLLETKRRCAVGQKNNQKLTRCSAGGTGNSRHWLARRQRRARRDVRLNVGWSNATTTSNFRLFLLAHRAQNNFLLLLLWRRNRGTN